MSGPGATKHRTKIGTPSSDISRLLLRGKDTLAELVGVVSFTESIFLAITGKMPTAQQTRILDACLVVLMDHGLTPSSIVARLVADSVPTDVQVPIAAGLLTVGNKFMGTIAGAGEIFSAGVASGVPAPQWAAERVADDLKRGRRFPGYGHPNYSPDDPRTTRLFQVAADAGVEGKYVTMARLIESELEKQSGRKVLLNATGAIGAMLCEIGLPVVAMRGVAVISRSAGLLAHAIEEIETKTAWPITSMIQDAIPYDD